MQGFQQAHLDPAHAEVLSGALRHALCEVAHPPQHLRPPTHPALPSAWRAGPGPTGLPCSALLHSNGGGANTENSKTAAAAPQPSQACCVRDYQAAATRSLHVATKRRSAPISLELCPLGLNRPAQPEGICSVQVGALRSPCGRSPATAARAACKSTCAPRRTSVPRAWRRPERVWRPPRPPAAARPRWRWRSPSEWSAAGACRRCGPRAAPALATALPEPGLRLMVACTCTGPLLGHL